MLQILAKKVQVGWQFKGTDIISEDYCREHFISGYAAHRGYVSRSVKGWEDDSNENMYTVECVVRRYRAEDAIPNNFEVLQVTRIGGKITNTKVLKAEKLFGEVEEEEIDEN